MACRPLDPLTRAMLHDQFGHLWPDEAEMKPIKQQYTLMKYDPATREEKPYPSKADQWRDWHGHGTAWLYNPWTGEQRHASDVGSDTTGLLILPPGEPIAAA